MRSRFPLLLRSSATWPVELICTLQPLSRFPKLSLLLLTVTLKR